MNPYAAPSHGLQGATPKGGPAPFASAARASKPAMVLSGLMAGLPILSWTVFRIAPKDAVRTIHGVWRCVDLVVGVVAMIFILLWIYRATAALRATHGTSEYSPGMPGEPRGPFAASRSKPARTPKRQATRTAHAAARSSPGCSPSRK